MIIKALTSDGNWWRLELKTNSKYSAITEIALCPTDGFLPVNKSGTAYIQKRNIVAIQLEETQNDE